MQHNWQSYTETCIQCGVNAWDKDFPNECPGSSTALVAAKAAVRSERRKQAALDRAAADDWNSNGW